MYESKYGTNKPSRVSVSQRYVLYSCNYDNKMILTLTLTLTLIVECIHFHKNIHPNITKRRSYSAEISRHPRLHTSLNAPTIPILLGPSTWREKKYPYKDGEHELWTVLWPYEFLLTRVPLHYGIRQVRTISWADMWSDFVLVYNLSKTTFVKFCVGFFAYRKFKCV